VPLSYATAGNKRGPNIRRAAAFPDQGIQRQATTVPQPFFSQITGHQHRLNDEHHHGQHYDHQLQGLSQYDFFGVKIRSAELIQDPFLKVGIPLRFCST
jgi:hypothetical protein